jgi:hypothetical protein
VADVFSSKEEPAVVAVTLKDLQTKLYTWRWPVGPKHVVHLNICNKEKRKHRPHLHIELDSIPKAGNVYFNERLHE